MASFFSAFLPIDKIFFIPLYSLCLLEKLGFIDVFKLYNFFIVNKANSMSF
ncbi:hypothetical protein NEOC65_000342 [Neochlamydia sp. AcF65]|nr:hypothetical protein [Neochlamydia sp. AcF65]